MQEDQLKKRLKSHNKCEQKQNLAYFYHLTKQLTKILGGFCFVVAVESFIPSI